MATAQRCTSSAQDSSGPISYGEGTTPPAFVLGNTEGDDAEGGPIVDAHELDSVPEEMTGATETLAQGEEAATLALTRGQHKATFTVPGDLERARSIRGETKTLEIDGELKRVHFYKVDAVPTGEKTDEGDKLVKVTAKFLVLDNPLPLVPIAWGAAALVGVGGGSWLLFDSAESFVESTQWPILTGAAAITGVLVAYDQLFA